MFNINSLCLRSDKPINITTMESKLTYVVFAFRYKGGRDFRYNREFDTLGEAFECAVRFYRKGYSLDLYSVRRCGNSTEYVSFRSELRRILGLIK